MPKKPENQLTEWQILMAQQALDDISVAEGHLANAKLALRAIAKGRKPPDTFLPSDALAEAVSILSAAWEE
jgi:hypothetical protein